VKLRLPTLMNKIFQAAPVSASDFVAHWRAIAGPPTKLQEVVRGVRPMPVSDMGDLFNSLHIGVAPGLVSLSIPVLSPDQKLVFPLVFYLVVHLSSEWSTQHFLFIPWA
jgi:hypothetical protein